LLGELAALRTVASERYAGERSADLRVAIGPYQLLRVRFWHFCEVPAGPGNV
jgi:hypothetical protein